MQLLHDSGTYSWLIEGDCREGMRQIDPNSVDSIVTDPPYGLSKQPDIKEVLTHWLAGDDHTATGGGFMGKKWDSFVPGPKTWEEAYRVLKPGGYCAVFAGSRTVDLMSMSLRLAGFEVVDMLHWLYGSGFPKSMNIEKATGSEKWKGYGTAVKPCHEPIILCRKPLDGTYANNVMTHGCGALNIEACRVPFQSEEDESSTKNKNRHGDFESGPRENQRVFAIHDKDRTNYDASGRFPGNVLHDGCLPEPMDRYFYCAKSSKKDRNRGLEHLNETSSEELVNRKTDSAGINNPRAGAGRTSGSKNIHPTVKPNELMKWLVRLVTPRDGLTLDPFMGSGSTGVAAKDERFHFIGCEMDPDYFNISQHRITNS